MQMTHKNVLCIQASRRKLFYAAPLMPYMALPKETAFTDEN